MADDDYKNRLRDLKEQLNSSELQLNTDELYADKAEFPNNNNDEGSESGSEYKYIDYTEEQKSHTEFATQVINNIVSTYVNKDLLNSNRLKDLKQQDILDYSYTLLMINIANKNLIKLQESIDSGDMSKEAFDSVQKAAKELRDNMKMKSEHLSKCEKYWDNYSKNYDLGNEEEKIITEDSENKNKNKPKTQIISQTDLINTINKQKEEMKENLKNNKKD